MTNDELVSAICQYLRTKGTGAGYHVGLAERKACANIVEDWWGKERTS